MKPLLVALRRAFHDPDARSYVVLQRVIWALIAISLLVLLAEIEWPQNQALILVDHVILGLFAIEISLRIASYRPPALDFFRVPVGERLRVHLLGRLRFALKPANLLDLLTVVALVPAFRGLRALRLLQLLRTVKVFRYSNPMQGFARALANNGVLFSFAISLLMLCVTIGGLCLYLLEVEVNDGMTSITDGIWWAIVTLTTVGYGDIAPVTTVGRIVAGVLMVAGMFLLALFAGIVSSTLLQTVLTIREEAFRMSAILDHVVVCGYDSGARPLLDALREELDLRRQQVMIFASTERPNEIPEDYLWVMGDPSKEAELDKARVAHAAAVIIVGHRSLTPQQADAMSILVAFTIRSYLGKHSDAPHRREPLYIVGEILDSENVAHAHASGMDEVIESNKIGFSLLSHALHQHGTARVINTIVQSGPPGLFVSALPAEVPLPTTFGELRQLVRAKSGALVVGLREGGRDLVNPADSHPVATGHELIYLADKVKAL